MHACAQLIVSILYSPGSHAQVMVLSIIKRDLPISNKIKTILQKMSEAHLPGVCRFCQFTVNTIIVNLRVWDKPFQSLC